MAWLSAAIAALIALWVTYQAHGVINNDGTLYIEAAQLFGAGQWKEGFAIYNWPLYPLLIMLTHKLSGLGFQISANLLTLLFFAATGWGITTLIRDIGGSCNARLAGLTLLIATPYIVGNILPMVVRDHGYWACHIWSLVFLLRFAEHPTWKNALLWGVLATLCMLFRIEGITYLLLAPLVLLAEISRPMAQRWRNTCKANALLIASALLLVLVVLLHPALNMAHLGRLREPALILELVYQQFTYGLANRADIIGQQALGGYLDDYGMPTLLLGLVYIVLFKAGTVAGLLQTGLVLGFWKSIKGVIPRQYWRILCWMLILGLLNASVILVKGFVLPKRILIPIGLVTIVLAAMATPVLFNMFRRHGHTLRLRTLGLLGLLLLVQILIALWPSPTSVRYERAAAEWVMQQAPPNSNIYFETSRMMFYAGKRIPRGSDWASTQESRWRNALNPLQNQMQFATTLHEMANYDYMLFLIKGKDTAKETRLTELLGQPAAHFYGPRGKKILVYRNQQAD